MEVGLTEASRRQLSARCRSLIRKSGSSQFKGWIERFRAPLVSGAALATVLALGVALLTVTRRAPSQEFAPTGGHPVQLVSVSPTSSGGVSLQWRDGNQRVYRVLKTTNPRDFRRAESFTVRGNHWTDVSPSRGGVVYYKIE
jgi:hypothetical protein